MQKKAIIIQINAVTLALSLPPNQEGSGEWPAVKALWEEDLCLKFFNLLAKQWKDWQGLEMGMLSPHYRADLKVHAQAKFRRISKDFAANKQQYIIVSQNLNIPLRQKFITKLIACINKEDLDEAIEHYLLELSNALKKNGNMLLLLTNQSEVDNTKVVRDYLDPYIVHEKDRHQRGGPIGSVDRSLAAKGAFLISYLEKNQLTSIQFKERLLKLLQGLERSEEEKNIAELGPLLQEIIERFPVYKDRLYLEIIKLCKKNASPYCFKSIQEVINLLKDYPKQATQETAKLLVTDCEESFRKNDKKIPATAKKLLCEKYLRSAAIDPEWTRTQIDAWLDEKPKNVRTVNWLQVVGVLAILGGIAFGAMQLLGREALDDNKWPLPPTAASEIYKDGQINSMVDVSDIIKKLAREGNDTVRLKKEFYELFLDKEAAQISVKDNLHFFDGLYSVAELTSKIIAYRDQLIIEGVNDFKYDLALLKNPKEKIQKGQMTNILIFKNMSGDNVDAFVPLNWSDTLWLHKPNFQYPPISAAWAIKFNRLSFNLRTR